MIMDKNDLYEKLHKPGLWFVRSSRPNNELCKYVCNLAVELGLPIAVYSNSTKKEIQNEVLGYVKAKCIGTASDDLERNWLEQEMSEYNTHGFFWVPDELNDYVPNGSFWRNYVSFDEFKMLSFTNSFSNIYLIDNLSELSYDGESDLQRILPLIEREAIYFKKTIVVFVSSYDLGRNEGYVRKHLLIK